MIFFYNDVTPQKRSMSEGCWLFILEENTNHQYFGIEAKMEKSKTTLFSQTFEVAENNIPLFFSLPS